MENIKKILKHSQHLRRHQRSLLAARVCQIAHKISGSRFKVISFKNGLLTLTCSSSAQAANLQAESQQIMAKINQNLPAGKAGIGESKVKRIRFKIT